MPAATFDAVPGVTTFLVGEQREAVLATLAGLGFELGPTTTTVTTLLDTFDGRVHRAGLRLTVTESEADHVVVELSGRDTPPGRVRFDVVPQLPSDLPPGPLRSRIESVIDIRAVSPQLRVTATQIDGTVRDEAGKTVAAVQLHDSIQILDRLDAAPVGATVEIHEMLGYAKPARRAVTALRRLGLDECPSDTLARCAFAAGVDLRGFTAKPTVPLDPAMPAADGYRLVLANLARVVAANWSGTAAQIDPEFLHDLRIAVRRTRTVLATAKGVLPAEILGPAREDFAWLAGLTSVPRDLDVYVIEWSRYTAPLGPDVAARLDPVRDVFDRQRSLVHGELEDALGSDRARGVMSAWQQWLAEPMAADTVPERGVRPLGPLVAKRIVRAHRTLVERGRLIDADTPAEQVHDLRKDAKKLRYLLECFGSLLPPAARSTYVGRLKALQDNLGEHQDAEVHVTMLREVADELHRTGASTDTMVAIGQLTERLEQQRLSARAEFAERFAGYDTRATRHALRAMTEGIAG